VGKAACLVHRCGGNRLRGDCASMPVGLPPALSAGVQGNSTQPPKMVQIATQAAQATPHWACAHPVRPPLAGSDHPGAAPRQRGPVSRAAGRCSLWPQNHCRPAPCLLWTLCTQALLDDPSVIKVFCDSTNHVTPHALDSALQPCSVHGSASSLRGLPHPAPCSHTLLLSGPYLPGPRAWEVQPSRRGYGAARSGVPGAGGAAARAGQGLASLLHAGPV